MGNVGGPRHYQGPGLGAPVSWNCPTCGTPHTTPLEAGCPVCLAEDARRVVAIAGAVTNLDVLATEILLLREGDTSEMIQLPQLTEPARQSLAAALAHYVEHGAPDASLLPRNVLIGWARELAGLSTE